MAAGELEEKWPVFPPGEEGKLLLDVVLDWPVDTAFLMLYGGLTELRKSFNELASNKEYSTTAWTEGAAAVQAAALGPTPPPLRDTAFLKPGMLRRASYSGTMMGSKYRNEELIRLLESSPGSCFRIMTTILTTAMHGEKFRPVVQSSLTALPDGRTQYKIRSVVLFIIKPNGFIKAMIDKGARDGQRKNFESLRAVLGQHTTVTEAADVLGQPAAAAAAAPEAAVAAAASPAAVALAPAAAAEGLLELVAGSTACRHLAPWAAFFHDNLAAAAPMLGELLEARVLLAVLAGLALLTALRLVVDMLLFVHHASQHPKDTIGLLTHVVFKVVDVPDSMQEVLLSCLIFYTARLLVNRLAEMLPAAPATRTAARPSLSSASGAVGSGAMGGADSSSPLSALSGLRSEGMEVEGIKYEGYEEAIAAAQATPLPMSGAATPERLSTTGVVAGAAAAGAAVGMAAGTAAAAAGSSRQQGAGPQQGGSFMKGFTKSISDAFTPGRPKKGGSGATAEDRQAVGASAPSNASMATRVSGLSEDEAGSGLCSAPDSPPSAGGPSPAATSPTAQSVLAVPRSLSESAAGFGGGLAAGLPPGLSGPPSPHNSAALPGDLPPGSALSPQRSLSPARGMPHSRSQGGLVEPSGSSVTSFAKKIRGVLSPTGQPGSPQLERKSMEEGSEGGALSPDQMLSPTAVQRDFRPAMPAHLPPELAGQAVIEEVFENQRLQPFRGWGHTWPGHFLPTDKVNHWSRREHDNFPVLAGPDFAAIAPPLPEGWQWCEGTWHLDRSGQIIDACDEEGWSYGLDFHYVRHPFQQSSGKKKMSDFVRRRRWIRTRVPLELAAQRTTTISEDNTSWARAAGPGSGSSGGGGGGGPLEVPEGATAAGASGGGDGRAKEDAEQDARDVHAVVRTMFAKVVAQSMEASMAEALAQQIGSRGSSGSSSSNAVQATQPPSQQPASRLQPPPASQSAARTAEGQGEKDVQPRQRQKRRQQASAASGVAGLDKQPATPLPTAAPAPAVHQQASALDQADQAATGKPQRVVRHRSGEGSVSFSLPSGNGLPPPSVEPRSAAHAASALTFSSAAVIDDLLVSPTEQLRGFERSVHGGQQAQHAQRAQQERDEAREAESAAEAEWEEGRQVQQVESAGIVEQHLEGLGEGQGEAAGGWAEELEDLEQQQEARDKEEEAASYEAAASALPAELPGFEGSAAAEYEASGGDAVAPFDAAEEESRWQRGGGNEGDEEAEGVAALSGEGKHAAQKHAEQPSKAGIRPAKGTLEPESVEAEVHAAYAAAALTPAEEEATEAAKAADGLEPEAMVNGEGSAADLASDALHLVAHR